MSAKSGANRPKKGLTYNLRITKNPMIVLEARQAASRSLVKRRHLQSHLLISLLLHLPLLFLVIVAVSLSLVCLRCEA